MGGCPDSPGTQETLANWCCCSCVSCVVFISPNCICVQVGKLRLSESRVLAELSQWVCLSRTRSQAFHRPTRPTCGHFLAPNSPLGWTGVMRTGQTGSTAEPPCWFGLS